MYRLSLEGHLCNYRSTSRLLPCCQLTKSAVAKGGDRLAASSESKVRLQSQRVGQGEEEEDEEDEDEDDEEEDHY